MNELNQVVRDLNALNVASQCDQVTNGEKLLCLRHAKNKLDRITYKVIHEEMKAMKNRIGAYHQNG